LTVRAARAVVVKPPSPPPWFPRFVASTGRCSPFPGRGQVTLTYRNFLYLFLLGRCLVRRFFILGPDKLLFFFRVVSRTEQFIHFSDLPHVRPSLEGLVILAFCLLLAPNLMMFFPSLFLVVPLFQVCLSACPIFWFLFQVSFLPFDRWRLWSLVWLLHSFPPFPLPVPIFSKRPADWRLRFPARTFLICPPIF